MIRFGLRFYVWVRRSQLAGISVVLGLLLLSLLGNATCFYFFDASLHQDDPPSFGDALWYSVISITTIGYGDYSARSLGARVGTVVFIIIVGMVIFTMLLGMLTEWAAMFILRGQQGMGTIVATNHILIVNFPGEARVRQLIRELQSDPNHQKCEIVVITDQIDQLPFALPHVQFVHGSPLEDEAYQRANIADADLAVILPTSYSDPNSDAVAAATVSVIESLNPAVYTVAECLDHKHRRLFASCNCDAVVLGMQIAGNLLVQEMHDPGVAQMIEIITSNLRGTTLFSTKVGAQPELDDYNHLAKALLDRGANLMCVNRGEESFTSFTSLKPRQGDILIYVAERRWTWPDLIRHALG